MAAGCEEPVISSPYPPSGHFRGEFVIEYDGITPDTCRVYVVFDNILYSVFYFNISDCAFGGRFYLDPNLNFENPTDECEHNDQDLLRFSAGEYEVRTPQDSLILTQTSSDTLRQYFLKQIYWME